MKLWQEKAVTIFFLIAKWMSEREIIHVLLVALDNLFQFNIPT